jgi:hypothetical protein
MRTCRDCPPCLNQLSQSTPPLLVLRAQGRASRLGSGAKWLDVRRCRKSPEAEATAIKFVAAIVQGHLRQILALPEALLILVEKAGGGIGPIEGEE